MRSIRSALAASSRLGSSPPPAGRWRRVRPRRRRRTRRADRAGRSIDATMSTCDRRARAHPGRPRSIASTERPAAAARRRRRAERRPRASEPADDLGRGRGRPRRGPADDPMIPHMAREATDPARATATGSGRSSRRTTAARSSASGARRLVRSAPRPSPGRAARCRWHGRAPGPRRPSRCSDSRDVVGEQFGDVGHPLGDADVHEHLRQRRHRRRGRDRRAVGPSAATTSSERDARSASPSPVVAWSAKIT